MFVLHTPHYLLTSNFPPSFPHLENHSFSPLISVHTPASLFTLSALPRTRPDTWTARIPESTIPVAAAEEEGPIELPQTSSSTNTIFATTDDPSPLQVATSVLLTGAISIFLFRSLRRRAKRAKELRFRSSEVKKSLKEEALDNLKAMGSVSIQPKSSPSPVQAFLGGITAGVIALILYKFTLTIEAALNRQAISDNFSVRQITVTVRTIVNGLCYLATFVFGINSIGLLLYSGQLAINSFMEESTDEKNGSNSEEQIGSLNSVTKNPSDNIELNSRNGNQNSDDKQ